MSGLLYKLHRGKKKSIINLKEFPPCHLQGSEHYWGIVNVTIMLIRDCWLRVDPTAIKFFSLHQYLSIFVRVHDHNISYFIIHVSTVYFFPFTYHLFFFYNSTRLKNPTCGHVIYITFCKSLFCFIYIKCNAEQMSGECPMARVVSGTVIASDMNINT